MNNNYYSDALKKADQSFEKLFEVTLKEVLSVLDGRKLEKSKDNVALVLAELMVEDEAITEKNDGCIVMFGYVLKQILEYLGIQKSRLFFSNDEKNVAETKELLVDKIKDYEEKRLEKRLQKEKRITNFKLKLSGIDFDYLKAFIEKIGLSHFAALSLLKLPKLEGKLERDNISLLTSGIKEKLKEIEENVWKNQEELSPIKNSLESLLLIAEELPRLKQLLEQKGIILNYSDLVDLLKIKYTEISDAKINPSKDNLYNSLKEMTLILFEKAKLKKTKEDVTIAFVAAVSAARKNNPEGVNLVLDALPNLLNEFLNKLLKEFNIIKNDLPQDEVKDLLDRKTNEVEIDIFEAELKRGVKTRMDIPSSLDTLSGSDFESFLEKLFRKLGYSVIKTPLTGDQGADLVVEKSGERIAVQTKRYHGIVSNKAVQEAVAAINHYKCSRAIVITTSSFTKSALKLAYSNKVELWDGKKLKEVMNKINK
jgi:hypothetical protein